LRRFFDIWGDPEKRDTTCWNNYYYYYRQIAQHTASISLRRLKWIAILFQAYFFVHLGLPFLVMAVHRKTMMPNEFYQFAVATSSMPPILLVLVLFLIPTVMVGNAFKLRQVTRGLMTSRAKEPPLLSHLMQYTTHSGLVFGALQSLFYSWCKFALYLLPAILTFFGILVYSFVWIAAHNEVTNGNATGAVYPAVHRIAAAPMHQQANWPVTRVLALPVTVCAFFLVQFFCYRLDTLAMMLYIGWLGVVILIEQFATIVLHGKTAGEREPVVHLMTILFIPACLFGMAYFVLAAADTMHYGLGKQAKWLRGLQLLVVSTGLLLFFNIHVFIRNGVLHDNTASQLAFLWTALGVFGLLADSLALATPRAKHLCELHASRLFPLKLFDVSSPLSLFPILALELLVILAAVILLGRYEFQYGSFWKDFAFAPGLMPIKNIWNALMTKVDNWTLRILLGIFLIVCSVIHLVLGIMIRLGRSNPQMKEPWNFYVRFNGVVMAAVAVGYIFFGGILRKPVLIVLFYLVSMIVLLILARDRKTSKTKQKDAAS
jgi:hypothetical protein